MNKETDTRLVDRQLAAAALAELEELTAEWWKDCELETAAVQLAAMIPGEFKERAFTNICRLLRQSHTEGLLTGMLLYRRLIPK